MDINEIKILCIIPARSGSKGLPGKNIMNFKGKPMLTWSIEHAQKCKYANNIKIIVSTDIEKYAKIAREYGAETPFLRPKEISGDLSNDYECVKHCVDWLKNNENYESDIILHLRPTQPCREVVDIDKCLDIFLENRDRYDSLRTVIPFEKSPYKMYSIDTDHNLLKPLFNEINGIIEPYNEARQKLPQCYLHNGYIDILNSNIVNNGTISGNNILPYVMGCSDNVDIDNVNDLKKMV